MDVPLLWPGRALRSKNHKGAISSRLTSLMDVSGSSSCGAGVRRIHKGSPKGREGRAHRGDFGNHVSPPAGDI
eukprot:4175312-Pyramimonas_sp.AAC.2